MKTTNINILAIILILLVNFSCTNIAVGEDRSPITIGILENNNFAYATMMRNSFELALESINARGGISGRLLRIAYADDGGKKRQGNEAVKSLIHKEKAVMLSGGYSSNNVLAMTYTADHLDIPFLVCTAADDRITRYRRENIFRLNPPASEYAQGLEQLLEQRLRPKSMAIVYENSPFGTSSATRMMWFCRKNQIEITAIIPYHRERAAPPYFDRILNPLIHTPPEAIDMASYMRDGVVMVQRIRAAGMTAHLLGGAGGFTHPDFITKSGQASKYMLTAALWTEDSQDPMARSYAARYIRKYQEIPDYHGAEAYSALLVAADALQRAETMQAKDIRKALNQTQMATPFGWVAFESYGQYERQNRQPTLVLQVLKDKFKCVWPQDISVSNLILPDSNRLVRYHDKENSR